MGLRDSPNIGLSPRRIGVRRKTIPYTHMVYTHLVLRTNLYKWGTKHFTPDFTEGLSRPNGPTFGAIAPSGVASGRSARIRPL